ncbi:Bacteriocin-protection, YdeI or OmpD-Associated [Chitinophaga costaii]|uniref:Bacteriocin-protection, YdeI or OmpD-Associated n=2 Tax=Chitinophaga costaii TaxID=1335309 RepID=A0A1C4EJ73_9BACT|nr:Bacteriocin-protection, YdeI or OmpD-Associated [Chitinophaga costaii]
MGEKTHWRYIQLPAAVAEQLMPGQKKSFRVKGKLDQQAFAQLALIPIGEGTFILPLNAAIRKSIGKDAGATLSVQIAVDTTPMQVNATLLECLQDEPTARAFFDTLPPSHQMYFSNWIDSAKTEATQSKRIADTVNALLRKQQYGEMIRANKKKNS